jgi:hypothetical protein
METEAPKARSDVRDVLAGVLPFLLTDYLRIRIHDWLGLTQPAAAAFGFFVAWLLSLGLFGSGRFGWRMFLLIILLGSLAVYFVGRLFHF